MCTGTTAGRWTANSIFLRGFEHVERLSLNLNGLAGVEGLARFTALRTLSLQGIAKRNVSVPAIEHATELQRLSVDQPVRDLNVIRNLDKLTELYSPATATALESLEGHPTLRRVSPLESPAWRTHDVGQVAR